MERERGSGLGSEGRQPSWRSREDGCGARVRGGSGGREICSGWRVTAEIRKEGGRGVTALWVERDGARDGPQLGHRSPVGGLCTEQGHQEGGGVGPS